MSLQTIPIILSLVALLVSIVSLLMARQVAWSTRYFERWFQLQRVVLEHPEALLPLWCTPDQYHQLYEKTRPLQSKPLPEELVFTEMFTDFAMEANRRKNLTGLLTGTFPGPVPLANPRIIHIWETHTRFIYSPKDQRLIRKTIITPK